MPLSFSVTLLAIFVALALARIVLRALPLPSRARSFSGVDTVLVIIGTAGLILHCGAMFYRSVIAAVPGMEGYIHTVNQLGFGSVTLFVIPSLILLVGLRRQQRLAVTLLCLALVAVGITMYDRGPLGIHLTTIFVSATLLAFTLALFVHRPRLRRRDAQR